MNSIDCKLKIKVCYQDKEFEDESIDIIPLQNIKEKAIKEFDIIKEDEDFINFTYHSNKDNKNYPIENDNDIIKFSDEDSFGNLFCNFELVINNPKREFKEDKLSNENKGEKIESKNSSNKDLNKINEKAKTDINEEVKQNYENEISKLKLEIEKINTEFMKLKKENSEKVKESEKSINDLKDKIKNKDIEITMNKSEINNLSSMLEETKKKCEIINNQKLQNENKHNQFNLELEWDNFQKKTDENYENLLNKISKLEDVIEKVNKNILDGLKNEKNEENKKMEENEKNKNIELIKSVIEQMKLEQNNEVIEKNKRLEEENRALKNKIKEIENQNNIERQKFEYYSSVLNEIYIKIVNDNQETKNIYNNFETNEKNINKKENDNKKKKEKSLIKGLLHLGKGKKKSNKNEDLNFGEEKETKKLSTNIINNDNDINLPKPQNSQKNKNNNIFLSNCSIYSKENINNTQDLDNKDNKDIEDKYYNISEQLKSFYESNISIENIITILFKIKDILSYLNELIYLNK